MAVLSEDDIHIPEVKCDTVTQDKRSGRRVIVHNVLDFQESIQYSCPSGTLAFPLIANLIFAILLFATFT